MFSTIETFCAASTNPFIAATCNHTLDGFDVIIHSESASSAADFVREFFGRNGQYLWSDFDGHHTFFIESSEGNNRPGDWSENDPISLR